MTDSTEEIPTMKHRTGASVSRRAALAGLGASGLGLALAAPVRHASAQDAAVDLTGHPVVGLWQEVAGGPMRRRCRGSSASSTSTAPTRAGMAWILARRSGSGD